MKVLVVDDDPLMRRLVVRLASRHPEVTIREAEHGADALAQIEADRPDLVFTDVEMPYLDGLGLLESIRASSSCRDLPVVAVSAVSDKALVLRMVDLGIEGYLLKPLDPASATARFDEILARVAARASHTPTPSDRGTLLVVDREAGYGEVVRAAVGDQFEVKDDLPAAGALAWAVEHRPAIALVGQGLVMPSADTFARALRGAAETRVVLLADHQPTGDGEQFSAVVARSHVPATLRASLATVILSLHDDASRLPELLRGVVGDEAALAARQALGIVTGQESELLDGEADSSAPACAARVRLAREDAVQGVVITLSASEADLATLQSAGAADSVTALLDALLVPIAARAAHVLAAQSCAVTAGAPEACDGAAPTAEAIASRSLRTEGGQLLRLHLASTVSAESVG